VQKFKAILQACLQVILTKLPTYEQCQRQIYRHREDRGRKAYIMESKLRILQAALMLAMASGQTVLINNIKIEIRKLEKKYRTGY
jgi:hypothetical protein